MSDMLLKGCGTALVTPFTEDGGIDTAAYAALIDRQVAAGVDFLVPLATTGETPSLSASEKLALMEIAVSHAAGRPLLVGCGSNSFNATLDNMELLDGHGVDAWLVVVPYYNKPTQEGQYRYFRAVAAATDKPIVIYNVPGRTGANMTADTCIRLANECENIIAIKEASGNYAQVSEIIRRAPQGFAVLSGDDDMTFAFMATGAHGVISVASNAFPAEVAEMTHRAAAGDYAGARELHHRLFPFFKACFVESNPIPVKAALEIMGQMRSDVRLPLAPASQHTKDIMNQLIGELCQK